jgi:hypothetical protein
MGVAPYVKMGNRKSKVSKRGFAPLLFPPPHDRNIYPYHGESKGGEASLI